jgi:hypothetical protein
MLPGRTCSRAPTGVQDEFGEKAKIALLGAFGALTATIGIFAVGVLTAL